MSSDKHISLPVRKVVVERLGPATYASPWRCANVRSAGFRPFVSEDAWVLERGEWEDGRPPATELLFEKAGAREKLFFNPHRATAAIMTCGGLCPGLNAVIRSLTFELFYNYGVERILGIRNGYLGLNPVQGPEPMLLTPDVVNNIQDHGGTILGSSRGPQDVGMMADRLSSLNIDMLFCVGGDGTQRGAKALSAELARRGHKIAVVGVPKTIDNDIRFCDRAFGMVTAVEKATEVLAVAHNEAKSAVRGIGLVKLMGRQAGFIACGATLASQDANYCFIPEIPFRLEGPKGFLTHLKSRMDRRGHALIVIAEGAGQQYFADEKLGVDASGNRRLHDIGPWLKQTIAEYFQEIGKPVDIKYIDPSYIIRSSPAICDDRWLCDQLARHAVHGALSGRTACVVCYNEAKFMYVPVELTVDRKQYVDPGSELWSSVLAATGQPAQFE